MAVRYYTEDCDFTYRGKRKTAGWIRRTAEAEGAALGAVSVIFCSDDYLLAINRQYLKHDYYTDIITFDYTEQGEPRTIAGDLMIGIGTVRENAARFGVSFGEELDRVIIHGVLHLLGYGDKSDSEAKRMRELENKYLALREEK